MTKTILLADDSVTIQKVVELTFMDGDYRVVAVGNGSDAAARLDEVRPDLILADVHMPGLNGYDLCRRVKEWRMGTPVLLLVGTFEPFDRDEFAACGAQGHMKKPFDSQELQRQVDSLLESSAPAVTEVEPEPEAEPMWVLSDPEPEPPPLPSSSWAETASVPPAWQQPTVPSAAAWDAPLPEQSWQSGEPSLRWDEPEAQAPSPTASVPSAALVGRETASISTEQLRAVTGGGQARVSAAAESPAQSSPERSLSDDEVDRIARRVVELVGDRIVRDVSWEVIPDLAEVIIKDRIRELEAQVE